MPYEVNFRDDAREDFDEGLDNSEREKASPQLRKLKKSPQLGEELGNRAGMDLTGFRKLEFDNKRYRIVYRILEDQREVEVWAIGKRDKMDVYHAAYSRLTQQSEGD